MFKRLLLGLIAAVSLVSLSIFPGSASAQETSGVKLQPAIFEQRVNPGDSLNSVIKVTNTNSTEQTFYMFTRNIKTISPEGFPIFADIGEKTGFELSDWLKLAATSVTIPAGATKEVPFTIIVPADARPGGHFGAIFASLQPAGVGQTGSAVGFEVATIVSLQISGNVVEEARIREFSSDKFIYGTPDVTLRTVVENLGNALIRARGPVEITNMFGKKVATLTMNDTEGAVLPGALREFKLAWKGESGLTVGRYQVLMGLVYGDEARKTITATTSFWVLPTNILVPVIGGIILVIIFFFVGTQMYVSRRLKALNGGKNVSGGSALWRLGMIALSVLAVTLILLGLLIFLG